MATSKAKILLSTDTLSGYGLDLIFQIAKDTGYDGIDLALWKNFDSRNVDYVYKLQTKYELPVRCIQLSDKTNPREMNIALEMARKCECDVISINSPSIFNIKSFSFLSNNLPGYRSQNPKIKFSIINPQKENLFILPIPKFRFSNVVDIIKKYHCYLAFDLVNIDDQMLETEFMRKIPNFIPYLSVVYLSDKSKTGQLHLPMGDGELKLPSILKKLKQFEYQSNFSIKLELDKRELSDQSKIELILKKCKAYYNEYYRDVVIE
jgi:sugar phosphate isomerase/epimerase